MGKAAAVQTAAALARSSKLAARCAIEEATRKNPRAVATKLREDPTLLNGYAEADVIIAVLHEAGHTEALLYVRDHRASAPRVRSLIVDRLLFG